MAKEVNSGRRRVPRRSFDAVAGVLVRGKYVMERAYQLGEGGMMIGSQTELTVGSQVVVSFFINTNLLIIVRGVVRSVNPAKDRTPARYGLEFLNLGFQFKREIRNFVAAGARLDGPLAL
jgi:hypothetical protein